MGGMDEDVNGLGGWGVGGMENEVVWGGWNDGWGVNEVEGFLVEERGVGIGGEFRNEGMGGVEKYIGRNLGREVGVGERWKREVIGEIG